MLIDEIKHIKSSKKDLRNFGMMVGDTLLVLGGILYWLDKAVFPYFLFLGAGLFLCGLLAPAILKPIQKVWMMVAVIMGWIMTRVILSILFYLVVSLIGLIGRLLGKQFLDMKIDKSRNSYWNYRDKKEFESSDYERQY